MNIWIARAQRAKKNLKLVYDDAVRSTKWHVLGGKSTFQENPDEWVNRHRWCFIVGCNNSGTSLLQDLLDNTGRVSAFEFEGQRYTKALARAYKKGYERVWSEYLDELRMTEEDSTAPLHRLLHDWFSELSEPVQDMILEKTTANAVRMRWLQKVFPNSYFIGMVRNGYAVTEGIKRKGRKDVARGAIHWNLANRIMRDDSRRIERYFELRYEDLSDNTAPTLERICQFLEIEPGPLLERVSSQGADRITVRNFNPDSIRNLSSEEIRLIKENASEMLDYYGYTPD